MRTGSDSAFLTSSILGRADASVQRASVQRAIIEFYSESLRLTPLRRGGGVTREDITHVRASGTAREYARADIIAHSKEAIAGEPLGVASKAPGWLELTLAWLGYACALLAYAGRRLWSVATSAPVQALLARVATLLAAAPARVFEGLARIAGGGLKKLGAAGLPRPTLARLSCWLGIAGLVALPLLPDAAPANRNIALADSSSRVPDAPAATEATAVTGAIEARPAEGTDLSFTRDNLRYCMFQEVRLGAIGPVTYSAEADAYTALVNDWNKRCARFGFARADKEAVDTEVKTRRVSLEAEGRALVRGWQRKIETALQRAPSPADMGAPITANASIDPLPAIIMSGRDQKAEISWGFNPLIKTPSLVLLRPDAATRVQERLNELGYAVKPADGTWGPSSRNALRRFKEANTLLWNDGFDIETVARLFSASALRAPPPASPKSDITFETAYPPPPGATMNPLNRTDAQRIQRRLAVLGYYGGNGDGLWGVTARRALRAFKTANDLADDDDWDSITESVLNEEQAIRVSAANVEWTGSTPALVGGAPTKPDSMPVPVPRPVKRSALPMARDEIPRPPAAIPPRPPTTSSR
jgi:peptidoglycan hydrolase-like protein with peptidoglycan-binding domain